MSRYTIEALALFYDIPLSEATRLCAQVSA